jgi:hypothetical protein
MTEDPDKNNIDSLLDSVNEVESTPSVPSLSPKYMQQLS